MHFIKSNLLSFCLISIALLCSTMSNAEGTYEEAEDAVKRGEYALAHELLLPHANSDHAHAQSLLGLLFLNGQGVAVSYPDALSWFEKSANNGNAQSQNNLGVMHAQGLGVPQSFEQAAKWFSLAADQGDENAQITLGHMYQMGDGVTKSSKEALIWYERSAAQGNPLAVKARDGLLWELAPVPKEIKDATEVIVMDNGQDHFMFNYLTASGETRDIPVKVYITKSIPAGNLEYVQSQGFDLKEGMSYLLPNHIEYSLDAILLMKPLWPIDQSLTDKQLAAEFGLVIE